MENYEYIDDLGSGSYGFVWKCLQRSTGSIVAVKGFKLAHTDKKFLDQAIREVRMLRAACDHPNIVQLLEAFRSSSGRVYMVFEFVERCLSAELHKRFTCGLPAAQTRLVLWQLLCAVAHLHSKKIVHRDIKPGNLLMTADGLVKLCDFGFARTTRGEPYQADRFSSYVVTRWYRSPEMLVSDLYSAASDVWSLGCTFAELATGRPLFPGTSSLDQLWRIMRCLGSLPPSQAERFAAAAAAAGLPEPPPPPPRGKSLWQRLPELETRLLDVVQACLRLDPTQRPTAVQLLQMPYFWEIPKLIAGTPLEHLRCDCTPGGPRTPPGRNPQQQQAAKSAAGAGAGAGDRGGVAVSVVHSKELGRTAVGDRLAAEGDSGAGAGVRRNPPRQASVLLSAVAASLIGELPPQSGGAGSVSLVPLAPPVGPASEAEAPAAVAVAPPPQQLPVSAGGLTTQASPLGQTRAAGPTFSSGSELGVRLPAATSVPSLPPPARTVSQTQVVSPPVSAVAPPATRVPGAAGTGAGTATAWSGSVPSLPHIVSNCSNGTGSLVIRSPSPSASASPGPPSLSRLPSNNAAGFMLPSIRSRKHHGDGALSSSAIMPTASAAVTSTDGLHPKSAVAAVQAAAAAPLMPSPAAADVPPSSGGLSPGRLPGAAPQHLITSGPIAAAAATAAGRAGPSSGGARPPDAATMSLCGEAPGGGSDGARRGAGGGYNGGLQPGFGLLGDCEPDLCSDGEGHISDDDELMEYFAGKQTMGSGAADRRPRADTGTHMPGAKLGSGSGHGAAAAVGGGPSARRMVVDTMHAGVQAVHHSLYGGRHGSGNGSMPSLAVLNRRVAAAAVLAGGSDAAAAAAACGSPQHQRLQQLAAPSAASAPAMRATVGSYLPLAGQADSAAAATKHSLAGLTDGSAASSRPRTAASMSASVMAKQAGAAGPSFKTIQYLKSGAEAQASVGPLPALGSTQQQSPTPQPPPGWQPHGTTTTGIGLTGQGSTAPLVLLHGRTSLPARGYGPVGGIAPSSLTQYGTSEAASAGRQRTLSRQGSVVFNQLMYDALPEIGTPGGAPYVPVVTPPRRRVVMSGFTPCRTAAARAAAEGMPPAAAMAAVMGEVLQSTTTDISVPFSPIHGARSVDLMSPEHASGSQAHPHHHNHAYDGSGAAAAAVAMVARRSHRRQGSAHFPTDPSAFIPGSSAGAADRGPPYPGAAVGPHNGTINGPAATSDTGMLLGSSAPSYFRTPRVADAGTGSVPHAAGAGALSAAGPVPIPASVGSHAGGSGSSRIPTTGSVNVSVPASISPCAVGTAPPSGYTGGPGPGIAGVLSRSGHPQPLTPATRSRLASGNISRMSDMSTGQAPLNACGTGTIEGTQSIELDGFEGMSPGTLAAASGVVGGGPLQPHLQSHPSHHGGVYGYPGMGPPQPPMGARGRTPRWAAGLIDSLPEDREVVHTACGGGEWRGGGLNGGAVDSTANPHSQVSYGAGAGGDQGPDAIQMLGVCSSEWNAPGVGSGHQGQVPLGSGRYEAAAAAAGSVSQLSPPRVLPVPRVSGPWPPAEPRALQSACSAELRASAPGAGDGAAAGSSNVGENGGVEVHGGGAPRDGSSAERKLSGGGSKWPRAKALLGGRLIASLVRKFKDGGAAGDK